MNWVDGNIYKADEGDLYNATLQMLDRVQNGPGSAGSASDYGYDADRASGAASGSSGGSRTGNTDMDDDIPF